MIFNINGKVVIVCFVEVTKITCLYSHLHQHIVWFSVVCSSADEYLRSDGAATCQRECDFAMQNKFGTVLN